MVEEEKTSLTEEVEENLDEEVGGDKAPEDSPDEPEDDTGDEDFDDEPTADDVGDDKDIDDTEPENTDIKAIRDEVGQLTKTMTNLAGVVTQLAQKQTLKKPTSETPFVPESVEDMTQREAAGFMLQKTQEMTSNMMSQMYGDITWRLETFGSIIDVLFKDHPGFSDVVAAMQSQQASPTKHQKFMTAYKDITSSKVDSENRKLKKQVERQHKETRKRKRNATRPHGRPGGGYQPKITSIADGIKAAEAELG